MKKIWIYVIGAVLVVGAGVGIVIAMSKESTEKEALSIYTWETYIDPEIVQAFEKKYDAHVTVHIFDNQFDMLDHYQKDKSSAQYDLINFDEEIAEDLRKLGVLSIINAHNVPNSKHIGAHYLRNPTNMDALYVLPYNYGTTGIVYNTQYLRADEIDWSIFWNPKYLDKSCLLDDDWSIIAAAALFKGLPIIQTTTKEQEDIKGVLLDFKNIGGKYCPASEMLKRVKKEDIWVAQMWSGDAALAMEVNKNIAYIIPKSGGIMWHDMWGIPSGSKHKRLAEKFLNYINDPEIAAKNSEYTHYATTNEAAHAHINPELFKDEVIYPNTDTLMRTQMFSDFPYYDTVIRMRNELREIIRQ